MSEELLLAVRQQRDRLEIEHLLDEEEANINYQNEDGISALHEATLNLNIDVMTLLLQRGAIVDLEDNFQRSALNCLEEYSGNSETDLLPAINLLLLFDANPDHANNAGDTLLKWAVFNGYVQITVCLLAADVLVTDDLIEEVQNGYETNMDDFDDVLDNALAARYHQITYLLEEARSQYVLAQEDDCLSSEIDSSINSSMR